MLNMASILCHWWVAMHGHQAWTACDRVAFTYIWSMLILFVKGIRLLLFRVGYSAPLMPVARRTICGTWVENHRLWSKIIPKYLAFEDYFIEWPLRMIQGRFCFRELKIIASVFCALNSRRHFWNQEYASFTCLWRWMMAHLWFLSWLKYIVSLANKDSWVLGVVSISFV